ncbi:MAG: hypothetical protein ACE5H4_00515 [Candidatus Thorarchaeota archaeon]
MSQRNRKVSMGQVIDSIILFLIAGFLLWTINTAAVEGPLYPERALPPVLATGLTALTLALIFIGLRIGRKE